MPAEDVQFWPAADHLHRATRAWRRTYDALGARNTPDRRQREEQEHALIPRYIALL